MRQMVWNVIKTTPWKYASGDYLWLFFTTVIPDTMKSQNLTMANFVYEKCLQENQGSFIHELKTTEIRCMNTASCTMIPFRFISEKEQAIVALKGQSLFEWRCVEFNLKGFDSWIIAGLHVLFNCKQIVLLSVPQHLNKYGNYNSYEINKSLKLTPSFDAILSAHISAKSLPSTPK